MNTTEWRTRPLSKVLKQRFKLREDSIKANRALDHIPQRRAVFVEIKDYDNNGEVIAVSQIFLPKWKRIKKGVIQ